MPNVFILVVPITKDKGETKRKCIQLLENSKAQYPKRENSNLSMMTTCLGHF